MTGTASAINQPFAEAVEYFRQKVNMPSKHWTAVMDEAHARAFAVAGAASDALVQDFRDAVHKAIEKGTSLQEFRGDFDKIVAKHGWGHTGKAEWRARVIYQTNLATAFAAGRYAQATDPDVLAAYPYWEYLHVNCPNPRLQHLAWSGLVLRADDAWWATNYPPNGWGCHCIVASLGPRDLTRRGMTGPQKAPPLNMMEYVNRTTGVVTKYPAGVDPGFAYNPGKAWKENASQPLKTPNVRPDGVAPPVLAQPGEKAVAPAVLEKFLAEPEGAVQVGELAAPAAKVLGGNTLLLSADTLAKQKISHPELGPDFYGELTEALAKPDVIVPGKPGQMRILARVGERTLVAVLKATRDGAEIYVVSTHYVGLKAARQFTREKPVAGKADELLTWMALKEKQAR